MGAYESNVNLFGIEWNYGNQPVRVPFSVENKTMISDIIN